jgi:hypothetical protein
MSWRWRPSSAAGESETASAEFAANCRASASFWEPVPKMEPYAGWFDFPPRGSTCRSGLKTPVSDDRSRPRSKGTLMSPLLMPATAVLRLLRSASRFPSGSSRTRSSGPKRSEGGDMVCRPEERLLRACWSWPRSLSRRLCPGLRRPGSTRRANAARSAGRLRFAQPSRWRTVLAARWSSREVPYELSVDKGSPSCSTVRKIARRYGHPSSKSPGSTARTRAMSSSTRSTRMAGGVAASSKKASSADMAPTRRFERTRSSMDPRPVGQAADPKVPRHVRIRWLGPARRSPVSPVPRSAEARCPLRERDRRKPRSLPGGEVACQRSGACLFERDQMRVGFDDPDPGPTFSARPRRQGPPFRCRVLSRAVRCTLIGSGRGFLINAHEARELV